MPKKLNVATFTVDGQPGTTHDGWILRSGKIFEAGDYPDKEFSLTPEEMAAAAAQFKPVPVDLEHVPTILDGKLGQLTEVRVDEDGKTLLGTVMVPQWLDSLLEEGSRKVSCTWNRATKQLEGLALVNRPRVADAALMAAFADHEVDLNVEPGEAIVVPPGYRVQFVAHDETGHAARIRKEKRMSFKDKVMAWFGQGMPDEFDETTVVTSPPVDAPAKPVTPPAPAADFSRYEQAIKDADAKIARLEADNRQKDAVAFAEAAIAAHKALPAEKELLVTQYVQAATDDASHPTQVTFAEGQSGSRVDAFRALIAARPTGILTTETLPANFTAEQVLANLSQTRGSDGEPLSEERKRALMSATPLGQATLNTNGK